MNSIQEINRINQRELDLGLTGSGSWHHQYSNSAYVHVGGLSYEMTEGDVLTVFSQFGEIMDINMPRDQETSKPRGFAFLMYEDQRSTVLAVDNMNGAIVLGRTIKVDHVHKYEQPGKRDEDGKYQKPEEPTYNAMPPELSGSDDSSESESDNDGVKIDPDDPMAAYLAGEKKKSKSKRGSGDKEEKKRRKEERRKKREEKERRRLIKELKGKEGGKGKGVKRERRDEGDDEGVASRDIAGRDRRGGERIGRDGSRSPKLERRSPIAQPGRRDAPGGRDKRDERDEPRRREREMSPVRRSNGSERNGERDTRRNGQGGQYDDRRRDGGRSYPEDRYDDRRRDDRDSSYNRRDRP